MPLGTGLVKERCPARPRFVTQSATDAVASMPSKGAQETSKPERALKSGKV
jgi:hypothetical protein